MHDPGVAVCVVVAADALNGTDARGRYAAGRDPAAYRPRCLVRLRRGAGRSAVADQKLVATSSTTKLVWSEESSVSANFSVTFVPL
ncbi:hypothetical protein LQK93_01984 [Terrabacter sp. BE26]